MTERPAPKSAAERKAAQREREEEQRVREESEAQGWRYVNDVRLTGTAAYVIGLLHLHQTAPNVISINFAEAVADYVNSHTEAAWKKAQGKKEPPVTK